MILPRSHTWMHLLPPDATFAGVGDGTAPAWFCDPLKGRGTGGGRAVLVAWQGGRDLPGLEPYDGVVLVNRRGRYEQRLRDAGFASVRRFAVVPSLREARWFIPLDDPAITSAAFCFYTPFRLSARFKLTAARAAIRARLPVWYRDQICIAQRTVPPLERTLQSLFPNRPIRVALSSGAAGPDVRRKPAVAVLGARGEQLAFAKLAGSSVARGLLEHEARVLTALAAQPGLNGLAPRLLFTGDVEGTHTLVQTPLAGRRVGPELTPAHYRFLDVLRIGPTRPAAASGMLQTARRLAWALPTPRTDLLDVLDDVMPVLSRLNVPVTIAHTDFVPWNLRRLDDGRIGAFDWDTAELDGLPLCDEARHLTFVGFCIHRWTAAQAHEQLSALIATPPLGLRPAQARALVVVYLVHSILKFRAQGHEEAHQTVVWHQELLARLHVPDRRPLAAAAATAPAGGAWSTA